MYRLCIIFALFSVAACGVVQTSANEEDISSVFYNLCDQNSTRCIGAWNKAEQEDHACFDAKNCTYAVAVATVEDGFEFSMLAVNKSYVSAGFSLDQEMGDDSVVSCVGNRTDGVLIGELSYNVGKRNQKAKTNDGLTVLETADVNGLIYCKFTLDDALTYARTAGGESEDNEFFIISVAGVLNDDGTVGHHMGHAYSEEKWDLTSDSASLAISAVLLIAAVTTTQF